MGGQYRIAIYMRLSKTDDLQAKEESNSIKMQRLLLKEYVQAHFTDYSLLEFCDDGYSGTSFHRPDVGKLLELVKNSQVDCIVVKDFSRFSRDYIELGVYLDRILPFMGIRFISVNDNYDSNVSRSGAGELDVSFRSLLYDLYSKDLSLKVKSALEARREEGKYVSGGCPFGYQKSLRDRHLLLPKKEEAEVVKRIFSMASEGMTCAGIARALNEEGIRTPAEFRIIKAKAAADVKGKKSMWTGPAVSHVLKNEAYAGDMVYGKTYRETVGGRNHLKPRKEWKVLCGHHEPLIDRETFEKVQKSRGKTKTKSHKRSHPLTGRLICGCCGRSLCYRGGLNPYFSCSGKYVSPGGECVGKLNVTFLEQYVLFEMQGMLNGYTDSEKETPDCNELYRLTDHIVQGFIDKIIVRDERHMDICWRCGKFWRNLT